MKRILVLFAHPLFEKSRIHTALCNDIPVSEYITFHDLYEAYPDFNINIEAEKEKLLNHDVIIWQHPLYWYNIPPLLKQWIDMVLQYGWAYGPGGDALQGKIIFQVLSAGGQQQVYSSEGRNRYTIQQFLIPLEQTAKLCHLDYLPPFVIHGTHLLTNEQIQNYAHNYRSLLLKFVNNAYNLEEIRKMKYLNYLVNDSVDVR